MNRKGKIFLLMVYSALIVCIFLSSFPIYGYSWEIDKAGTAYNIVDGDTLDVSSVGRIRLADIDCPEPGESGGASASQYLSFLVYQKEVYVDVDDVHGTDLYGRIVAVLYVRYDATRLKNVNKAMLASGHAEIWNFNNEFDPYAWTLYVTYQENPPPDDPPPDPPPPDPPPSDPPPPDVPPDEPNDPSPVKNLTAVYGGIGVGACAISLGAVSAVYVYKKSKSPHREIPPLKHTQSKASQKFPSIRRSQLIKDITRPLSNITIHGNVEKVYSIREFTRRDGSKGKVRNCIISDRTGSIRVVLRDNRCYMVKESDIGKKVRIKNCYSKLNDFYKKGDLEIQTNKYSRFDILNQQ
jgi:hypothetical protein